MASVTSVARDFTAPYAPLESWFYDRVIAPAVARQGRRLLDEIGSVLPDTGRLLDVGCGGGQVALLLAARRPALSITGLDLSPEQIARARRRAAGQGERIEFVVGSALELPFADASFDVVLSVASIKHWPDPARGLAECVRVLAPGGALLVIEADRGCRLADARRFVEGWGVPRALRPAALAAFRTWVAGQSLDLDEARGLLEPLALVDASAQRVEGMPALALRGRKRRAP